MDEILKALALKKQTSQLTINKIGDAVSMYNGTLRKIGDVEHGKLLAYDEVIELIKTTLG